MKCTAYGRPDEETLMNHALDVMTRKLRKHYRHKIKKAFKTDAFPTYRIIFFLMLSARGSFPPSIICVIPTCIIEKGNAQPKNELVSDIRKTIKNKQYYVCCLFCHLHLL